MSTRSCHHFGLRVADLERSVRFYEEAFGATRLTLPFVVEGPLAETLYGGGPGTSVRVCHVGFADGGGAELFQFDRPARGPREPVAYEDNIIHVALHVESVEAALERVRAAGGTVVGGQSFDWGGTPFAYILDPDGTVVEVAEIDLAATVALVHRLMPHTVVGAAGASTGNGA